ncbi:conserved hypothetical protein [Ricinus communis]|uniref:Uncharacterized protein n=1 Tax=Ricinus communis TaxID=3988 RepID=B9S222_RICCO|nr:conserved hypothetical protein [Ricinus communis]
MQYSSPSQTVQRNKLLKPKTICGERCHIHIHTREARLQSINQRPRQLIGGFKSAGKATYIVKFTDAIQRTAKEASRAQQQTSLKDMIIHKEYIDAAFKARGLQWNGAPSASFKDLEADRAKQMDNSKTLTKR